MKKIIFLDVDGTLIDYKRHLPSSAADAINKARKNGHLVFICTGCSKGEILDHHFPMELDGMIGANGGYIEYHDEVIFHKSFSREQIERFVNWCESRDLAFHLECDEGMFGCPGYMEKAKYAFYQYVHGRGAVMPEDYNEDFGIIETDNFYRDDVNKVDYVIKTMEDLEDCKKEFPDMKCLSWGGKGGDPLFGDIGLNGIDKLTGIKYVLDYLGIDKKDTIGFGDAKVDVPMFEICDYSVAMGNGDEICKNAADYITDDVNNDGLYKAFEKLGLI
ncbi:MAG: HAD family hydrolase [Erysipelotrichaceae bacterium]|nr:HAD family hydrolase [Erysipelotrichaceae bacterium]